MRRIHLALLGLAACGGGNGGNGQGDKDTTDGTTTTDGDLIEVFPPTSNGGCNDPSVSAFAGTCVQSYFVGCFDPEGTCTVTDGAPTTTITWDNGAMVRFTAGEFTQTEVTSSYGWRCATGATQTQEGAECVTVTTWVRADGATQMWCIHADGAIDVTCQDQLTQVSVSAADAPGALACEFLDPDCDIPVP